MLPFPIPRRLSEGFAGLLRAVFDAWHSLRPPALETSSESGKEGDPAGEEVSEESEESDGDAEALGRAYAAMRQRDAAMRSRRGTR